MHSDVPYDMNVCDCSRYDCSLIATIVLGGDRGECFQLQASILKSLESRVQSMIGRVLTSDRKASSDVKPRREHGSDAEHVTSHEHNKAQPKSHILNLR
jgi:hypothetical protein